MASPIYPLEGAARNQLLARIRAFLSVAKLSGIEAIEAKIREGFLEDGPRARSQRTAVERQLRKWVETNPEGRYRHAIPAARSLYELLFGSVPPQAPGSSAPARGHSIPLSYSLLAAVLLGEALRLPSHERPRLKKRGRWLVPDEGVEIVQPGQVPVFKDWRQRMVLLSADRSARSLVRKASGDRFGEAHQNLPRIGSVNSEDALSWSIMRSLEKRGSPGWFQRAIQKGLERAGNPTRTGALKKGPALRFWHRAGPPQGYPYREGATELDVVADCGPQALVAIEAKVGSEFSAGTTHNPERHQFLRVLDVLLGIAEGDRGWGAVLVPRANEALIGEVRQIVQDPATAVARLGHRDPARVRRALARVAILTWEDLLEEVGVDTSELEPLGFNVAPESGLERPLVALHKTISSGTSVASLVAKPWRVLYASERRVAPRRHNRDKRYFVGHSDMPTTTGPTNRHEEHFAIALWREHGPGRPPITVGEDEIRLLDYQVPLKSARSDAGVGKVDLLGVDQQGRLCVIELKSGRATRADTPSKALVEGLAYAAVVEENLKDIASEARAQFQVDLSEQAPRVIVAASTAYWERQRREVRALAPLLVRISAETQVSCAGLDLGRVEVENGNGDRPPVITSRTAAHWVF